MSLGAIVQILGMVVLAAAAVGAAFNIVATVALARFLRRAVVRLILEPQGTPDTVPFTILDWGGAGT